MSQTKKQRIITLISEKGGGKGTAAKYLEKKYRAKTLRFSFFIEETLRALHLPTNDRTLIVNFIQKLRELAGNDILAQIITRKIKKTKNSLIVLDGLRFPEEEKFLRNHLQNFFTVGIFTNPKIRHSRIKLRGERKNETNVSFPQFLKEDKLPTERFIKRIMKTTDYQTKNNGTEEELKKQLDKIIKKLYAR